MANGSKNHEYRPEKKIALGEPRFDGILAAERRIKEDLSVRVVVLSGEGDAFSLGLDFANLAEMAPGSRSVESESTGGACRSCRTKGTELKAWRIHRYDTPSRALELDDIPRPEAAEGQVLIRVRSLTINANDIDGCYGRYKIVKPELPFTPGMELMGIVEAAGPGCENWIGKRVIACPSGAVGGFAEYAVADEGMLFEAPSSLDDVAAGAVFFPYHLAYLSVHTHGRLLAGQTLLVHGASGGVGSAAIQLGVAAGARVIAVAGGPEKSAHCSALGAHVVVDHQRDDFVEVVQRETRGRGVDVVCDLVGGEISRRSFPLVAFQGRYMMTGFVGGIGALDGGGYSPQPVVMGNFSLGGVLLVYAKDPQRIREAVGFNPVPREVGDEIHAALLALFDEGALTPPVTRVIDFSDVPSAMEAKEARETIGRVVIEMPPAE